MQRNNWEQCVAFHGYSCGGLCSGTGVGLQRHRR